MSRRNRRTQTIQISPQFQPRLKGNEKAPDIITRGVTDNYLPSFSPGPAAVQQRGQAGSQDQEASRQSKALESGRSDYGQLGGWDQSERLYRGSVRRSLHAH